MISNYQKKKNNNSVTMSHTYNKLKENMNLRRHLMKMSDPENLTSLQLVQSSCTL